MPIAQFRACACKSPRLPRNQLPSASNSAGTLLCMVCVTRLAWGRSVVNSAMRGEGPCRFQGFRDELSEAPAFPQLLHVAFVARAPPTVGTSGRALRTLIRVLSAAVLSVLWQITTARPAMPSVSSTVGRWKSGVVHRLAGQPGLAAIPGSTSTATKGQASSSRKRPTNLPSAVAEDQYMAGQVPASRWCPGASFRRRTCARTAQARQHQV